VTAGRPLKFFTWQKLRKKATSGSDIWLGPSAASVTPAWVPVIFQVGPADDGHLDLVVGADDELGEGRAEWDLPGRAQARGDTEHVLLGDFCIRGIGPGTSWRTTRRGGVFDIGIEGHDALVGRAEGDECRAVGLARAMGFPAAEVLVEADPCQTSAKLGILIALCSAGLPAGLGAVIFNCPSTLISATPQITAVFRAG